MLTFNAILKHERIEPSKVHLVRHQDTRGPKGLTPYNLWRSGDGRFELYQSLQREEHFQVGGLVASFVADPRGDTLFVGLYNVQSIGRAAPGMIDPVRGDDMSDYLLYELRKDPRMSDYAGLLVVNWGAGFRSWVQRADRQDKQVLEIRKDKSDPPFPGFTHFRWDIDNIEDVPPSWQEVLRSVKGVYLLVCKETGKQYVGSAKGEESLWGRFVEYSRTGHGGNVEMKRRGRKPYQVTVLEVANSGFGIERIEEAWKRKLMSREFGLNDPLPISPAESRIKEACYASVSEG